MGQVLLVRHGQASFGAEDYDLLSGLGEEQSRLLGVGLAARGITADVVVRGEMRRHQQTAKACVTAAGWSADEVVDAGWNEFDFLAVLAAHPSDGLTAERNPAEFQRRFESATASWIAGGLVPGGESFAEFTSRVTDALDRVVALAGDGRTVVVFTSGGPVAWAVSTVLADGGGPDLWTRLNRMTVNSGLTRLVAGRRGLNLLSFNEQSHLDGVPGAVSYR